MADLKTNLLGFTMNSPIIGASGTVGYGVEYEELADFSKIGGISGKGLTLYGQYGNKGERLWETPSGLINSIGLQNPGVQHFIDVCPCRNDPAATGRDRCNRREKRCP